MWQCTVMNSIELIASIWHLFSGNGFRCLPLSWDLKIDNCQHIVLAVDGSEVAVADG